MNRQDIRCFNCGKLLFKMLPTSRRKGGLVHIMNYDMGFLAETIEVPENIHVIGYFQIKCPRCKTTNEIAAKVKLRENFLAIDKIKELKKLKDIYDLYNALIEYSYLINLSALERQNAQERPTSE